MLEVKSQSELAHAVADDPDANFAVAEGLPHLRAVNIGGRLVKTRNDLIILGGVEQSMSAGSGRRRRSQKRPTGNTCHGRIPPQNLHSPTNSLIRTCR